MPTLCINASSLRTLLPVSAKVLGALAVFVVCCYPIASASSASPTFKILRTADRSNETSFDPQYESDAVTNNYMAMIFESPLEYDLLARPVKLRPLTLESLPEISDEGRTYTLRVKPGT
jgi:ABC-type oligopeptide transport system substrate-binding subunit